MLNPTNIATAGGASSSSNPWLDPSIWCRLPPRLVDRILAFLPPPAFFRARCVCKRWYALLFSDSFLELHFHLSPKLRWFIFFPTHTQKGGQHHSYIRPDMTSAHHHHHHDDPITGYAFLLDPIRHEWHRLPSPLLLPPGFYPVASSGGLVCWMPDEPGPKSLLLSNPLSRSLAQLPPTIRPRLFPSVGLAVGPASLDVVVSGDDLISPFAVKNLTTESFHADGGGYYSIWATTCDLPRLCSFESGRSVYIAGKFYCMNYSPFSVLSYDVSDNTWCKTQAPMRRFLRSPSLVECRGRVVLVAAVEKSKLNVPRSARIWGLQPCGQAWSEVERMPQPLYEQFAETEGGAGFDCVGHGDFIAIVLRRSGHVLLFDFYRKTWSWTVPCPFTGGSVDVVGFPYEPRLATPAIGLLDPSFQGFGEH